MNVKVPVYRCWIILFVLIISFTLIVFNNIDYEKFYLNSGVVVDYNTIKVYCIKNDLNKIVENKKIIIEEENFAYNNILINNIVYDEDYYIELIFNAELNDKLNIKNNIIDFKISLEKQTILKYILSKIGGLK